MANATSGSYSFAADPRAVAPRGTKYRKQQNQSPTTFEDELSEAPGNIMYDPRVVRGSTISTSAGRYVEGPQTNSLRRRNKLSSNRHERVVERAVTPRAVQGRTHIDCQTDDYLEELTDRPPESDMQTQTDIMKDRPPSPLFMPVKSGIDKATQIDNGDLFDFNVEVEPILEVLLGKTLEQGMDEVLEEEELANIRAHKDRFEQLRNSKLAEVQRLEAEAKRREEEKTRRFEQEKTRLEQEEEVMEKVAARGFAKHFLSDLHDSVFDNLMEEGYFHEIEADFIPWLHDAVAEKVDKRKLARRLADVLLTNMFSTIPEKMEKAKKLDELRIEMIENNGDQEEVPVG